MPQTTGNTGERAAKLETRADEHERRLGVLESEVRSLGDLKADVAALKAIRKLEETNQALGIAKASLIAGTVGAAAGVAAVVIALYLLGYHP